MAYQHGRIREIRLAQETRRSRSRRTYRRLALAALALAVLARGGFALLGDIKPAAASALSWARGCR